MDEVCSDGVNFGWWIVVFLVSFLSFIQTSHSAQGAEFISFVQGDPGLPGDGIFVNVSRNRPRYHLAPTFPLAGINDGITVIVFLEDSTVLPHIQINVEPTDTVIAPICNSAHGRSVPDGQIIFNGVTGYFINITQSDLELMVNVVRNLGPECENLMLDDFVIWSLIIALGASGSDFATTLDAFAIGLGQNNVPVDTMEGPPGDPTCSDGDDNDGDGFTDLEDIDCIPKPSIEEYAPILRFKDGEDFFPVDFNEVFMNFDTTSVQDDLILYLDFGDSDQSTDDFEIIKGVQDDINQIEDFVVYGRALDKGDLFYIQYWFFYLFNDWKEKGGWNNHEGDWEMITIEFTIDNGSYMPLRAGYSQHLGGEADSFNSSSDITEQNMIIADGTSMAWETMLEKEGNHPIVYVGLGSHANYFESSNTSLFKKIDKHNGDGKELQHGDGANGYELMQLSEEELSLGIDNICPFFWGWLDSSQFAHISKNLSEQIKDLIEAFSLPPPSPNCQEEKWDDPGAWLDSLSSDISISPNPLDFGSVKVGKKGRELITISNKGNAPLILESFNISGPDAASFKHNVKHTPTGALPLSSIKITVTFSPQKVGEHSATLSVSSNDPDESNTVIVLTGNGVPKK